MRAGSLTGIRGSTLMRKGLVLIVVPVAFQLLLLAAIAAQHRVEMRDRALDTQQKEVRTSAMRILTLLVDVETGIRGYAITGKPLFVEPSTKAVAELPANFQRLRELAPSREGVARLEALSRPVLAFNDNNRWQIASGHRDLAIAAIDAQVGKKFMDSFRAGVADFLRDQEKVEREHEAEWRRSEKIATALLWTGFLLNVILAAGVAMTFSRGITTRMHVMVENMERLTAGEPLRPVQSGSDEITALDHRFHEMADGLRVAQERLEESNRELESFSYSVSHDLRAPLRAIDGYAQMLQEDYGSALDERADRYLRVVRNEAARLGTLIDDLLTFSRLGRKGLESIEFDVSELAREAFKEVTASQPENRAVELQLQPLPQACADRTLIRQVFTNLIGNAVKFSGKKPHPVVAVGGSPNGVETTYWVRDNGAGFDPRYGDKLFGVFQRLHEDTDFPGTGVGLAIVRRIVQKHGGRVWAEGMPGKGACFYFTLPATKGVQHV
jgi:signal transduction histidine kinase